MHTRTYTVKSAWLDFSCRLFFTHPPLDDPIIIVLYATGSGLCLESLAVTIYSRGGLDLNARNVLLLEDRADGSDSLLRGGPSKTFISYCNVTGGSFCLLHLIMP